jgi:hypothetical protein
VCPYRYVKVSRRADRSVCKGEIERGKTIIMGVCQGEWEW